MRIKVIIGLLMFGLFSCENDPNVVLPEKENEPYVYSDSLLDEYQKKYDSRNAEVIKNQLISDSLYDVLIAKIDSLIIFAKEDEVGFYTKELALAEFIRKEAIGLNNFFVNETSNMIKFSKDENFGLENEGGEYFENHYKLDYLNGQEYFVLFSLSHLKNRGDYQVPNILYATNYDGYVDLKGGFLLDSVLEYRYNTLRAIFIMDNHIDFNKLYEVKLELYTDENEKIYREAVKACLYDLDELDTEFISEFCRILVIPELELKNGEIKPWIAARFDRPILGAADTFLFFRFKVILSEIHVYNYLLQKLESN